MSDIGLNINADNLTIGSFECQYPDCSLSFCDSKSLEKHMIESHIEKFWCKECNISCKTSDDFKSHNNSFHSGNIFETIFKEVQQKDNKRTKILTQRKTTSKPIPNLISKPSSKIQFIDLTQEESEAKNPLKSQIVGNSCDQNLMKTNIFVPMSEKIYSQRFCEYPNCLFSCNELGLMISHMKIVHSIHMEFFQCSECQIGFAYKWDLIVHRRDVHKENNS